MAITEINRGWTQNPAIVHIVSDDTLATALGSSYLDDQADNIEDINNGAFEWDDNDLILLEHSAGSGFFRYDSANNAIISVQPYGALYVGQETTAGGAAAEAFTVTGVAATDLAFVQMVDDGTAGTTILQAACTADTLTVTFSANPGNDAVFNYQIIRP